MPPKRGTGNVNALRTGQHSGKVGRLRRKVSSFRRAEERARRLRTSLGFKRGDSFEVDEATELYGYALGAVLTVYDGGERRGWLDPKGNAKSNLRDLAPLALKAADELRKLTEHVAGIVRERSGQGGAPVDVYVLLPGGLSLDDAAVGAPLGRPGANGEQDVPVVAPAHTFDGGAPGASQEAE